AEERPRIAGVGGHAEARRPTELHQVLAGRVRRRDPRPDALRAATADGVADELGRGAGRGRRPRTGWGHRDPDEQAVEPLQADRPPPETRNDLDRRLRTSRLRARRRDESLEAVGAGRLAAEGGRPEEVDRVVREAVADGHPLCAREASRARAPGPG